MDVIDFGSANRKIKNSEPFTIFIKKESDLYTIQRLFVENSDKFANASGWRESAYFTIERKIKRFKDEGDGYRYTFDRGMFGGYQMCHGKGGSHPDSSYVLGTLEEEYE